MVEKKTLGLTKESLAQLPFLDVGSGPIDLVPSWLQLLLQAGLAQETKGQLPFGDQDSTQTYFPGGFVYRASSHFKHTFQTNFYVHYQQTLGQEPVNNTSHLPAQHYYVGHRSLRQSGHHINMTAALVLTPCQV